MKVKEKLLDGCGCLCKFQSGEVVEWWLCVLDNLFMELRICVRVGNRSVNEEIIVRFLLLLNYQLGKFVIKNVEGECFIVLVVKFEEWLGKLFDGEFVDVVEDVKVLFKQEQLWVWCEGERILFLGKIIGYSMCIFENFVDEIRVMVKVYNCSFNDEMFICLMNMLGYFMERLFDQNEDVQVFKVFCMEFEVFLKEKIREVEKSDFLWDEKLFQ